MPLRISPGGNWQYRFKVGGIRYEKVTGWEATSENVKRAETEMKRHRDAILRGDITATTKRTGHKFSELSVEFMNSLAFSRIKESSVTRIGTSMVSLRVWFRDMDLGKIDTRHIESYKQWRLRGDSEIEPVAPVTVRHDLAALSKFYGWAKTMKLATLNPVRDIEKPSDPEGEIRMHILTAAEEMDYFHRCEQAGYRNLADVSRLMLEQGMKPDEAMNLEKRGVDLEANTVKIFQGKRKSCRRTLKLTAVSREIVARRMWESGSTKWLFPSPKTETRGDLPITKLNGPFNKIVAAKAKRPQLDFVLYDLRHTWATRKAAKGMPPTTLAAVLGHSSLRMITRYVHPTQEHMDYEITRIEALEQAERESRQGEEAICPGPIN